MIQGSDQREELEKHLMMTASLTQTIYLQEESTEDITLPEDLAE